MSHDAHDPLSSASLQPPPGGSAPCACLIVLSTAQEYGMPYKAIMGTEGGDTCQELRGAAPASLYPPQCHLPVLVKGLG